VGILGRMGGGDGMGEGGGEEEEGGERRKLGLVLVER